MASIVDTSVLYALTDSAEPEHRSCVEGLAAESSAIIVPAAVLPEICYIVHSRLGAPAEVAFLRALSGSDWRVEPTTDPDLRRTVELLERYADADLGFVDASIVAIAERLGVTRLYTLDQRDFGLVRPSHIDWFELLPEM